MASESNLAKRRGALPEPSHAPGFSDEALLLTDAPVPGRPPAAAPGELQAEVITAWPRLTALEAEWQDLAAAAGAPNPVYEPPMLLPAPRAHRAGTTGGGPSSAPRPPRRR